MIFRTGQALGLVLAAVLLSGCAGLSSATNRQFSISDQMRELYWYTQSAEMRVLYLGQFRLALERIAVAAADRPAGSWAVIADADETLVDNQDYRLEQARYGRRFALETWNQWVPKLRAVPTPGALEFAQRIQEMGGLLVIVTNRSEAQCTETRANFELLSMPVHAVMCKAEDSAKLVDQSSKQERFDRVEKMKDPFGNPLKVLAYLGDNIDDFPRMTQAKGRAALDLKELPEFQSRYFLFPNPMYGSWEP